MSAWTNAHKIFIQHANEKFIFIHTRTAYGVQDATNKKQTVIAAFAIRISTEAFWWSTFDLKLSTFIFLAWSLEGRKEIFLESRIKSKGWTFKRKKLVDINLAWKV